MDHYQVVQLFIEVYKKTFLKNQIENNLTEMLIWRPSIIFIVKFYFLFVKKWQQGGRTILKVKLKRRKLNKSVLLMNKNVLFTYL